MSHSPASPPQFSNNTKNNSNTENTHSNRTNTSPAQLAHILSTLLTDNETLSKDLAVSRGYDLAEQTLALLTSPHTSVIAASDAPSPSCAYPETAVRTIMDLQSHLAAEKAARETAESRLRTISEDLERYFQASEVQLSDARGHFSQLIRDPSARPSFDPLPAYHPRRSNQSAPPSPVPASQTFPTISRPSSVASLPACDDNAEGIPPPKRICTDCGLRHSTEFSRIHTHVPPSRDTPEVNHHLHPAHPLQQPPSRGRRPERRDGSPSVSSAPTRSRSSSMLLDELFLEATDNKSRSLSSPQPAMLTLT